MLDSGDVPPDYDGDGVCDALDTDVDIVIDDDTPTEEELDSAQPFQASNRIGRPGTTGQQW